MFLHRRERRTFEERAKLAMPSLVPSDVVADPQDVPQTGDETHTKVWACSHCYDFGVIDMYTPKDLVKHFQQNRFVHPNLNDFTHDVAFLTHTSLLY